MDGKRSGRRPPQLILAVGTLSLFREISTIILRDQASMLHNPLYDETINQIGLYTFFLSDKSELISRRERIYLDSTAAVCSLCHHPSGATSLSLPRHAGAHLIYSFQHVCAAAANM